MQEDNFLCFLVTYNKYTKKSKTNNILVCLANDPTKYYWIVMEAECMTRWGVLKSTTSYKNMWLPVCVRFKLIASCWEWNSLREQI